MTIKLTKLPKTADRWITYGFDGYDCHYRIENRIGTWKVTIKANNWDHREYVEYNTLAECRAFVEAYDASVEPFGTHARWDKADDAARRVRGAMMDALHARNIKKVDEVLGR